VFAAGTAVKPRAESEAAESKRLAAEADAAYKKAIAKERHTYTRSPAAAAAAVRAAASPGKDKGWFAQNWPFIVGGVVVVGVTIGIASTRKRKGRR
jgi:hypothetical protein